MADILLSDHIEVLESHAKYLSEPERVRLIELLGLTADAVAGLAAPKSNTIFDYLATEIDAQLIFLKSLRERVTSGEEHIDTRQIKDLMQATSSLFKMLTQINKDITNQGRLRKVEMAVVETIKTLNEASQATFFKELETRLAEGQDD